MLPEPFRILQTTFAGRLRDGRVKILAALEAFHEDKAKRALHAQRHSRRLYPAEFRANSKILLFICPPT